MRVLFAVARLPIVEVCITSAEAAALFSRDFTPISAPIFGGRLAQAVLDLEPDDQAYLSGRSRQALRTNMKHAQKRGVEVTRVASYGEWSAATQEILGPREGAQERLAQLRPPPDTQDMGYFVAVDDTGHPVAISAVAIFSDYAMLVWSLSAPDHPAASSSRYLLQQPTVRSNLRGQGVRHLIAGTGWGIARAALLPAPARLSGTQPAHPGSGWGSNHAGVRSRRLPGGRQRGGLGPVSGRRRHGCALTGQPVQ